MIWDFFKKKKKEDETDALHDLILDKMKPGFLVDFDMKTYRVNARNQYRWHEGGVTDEWELKQGAEVFYLEREEEDGVRQGRVHISRSEREKPGEDRGGVFPDPPVPPPFRPPAPPPQPPGPPFDPLVAP